MSAPRKYEFSQIMVDVETLATTADAVILSIGAVKFNLDTERISDICDQAFYASISIDSQMGTPCYRRINEATLIWWLNQSHAAQQVFNEQKDTLLVALQNFADWFDHPDYEIWSNGADFDISMLAHAFGQTEIEVPWKFWNARCYRTAKKLNPAVPLLPAPGAHNALVDAMHQAQHLQRIMLRMNTPVAVT